VPLLLADPLAPSGCSDPVAGTRRGRLAPWRSPPGQSSWARPALLGIAAVAVLLYARNIADAGLSPFYSVAVKSMSESWKAFFYGAFDPKATITIDKLAGSFLPQALSARIFGFHPWSLALPQVVEGVVTVLVMYRVVRRWAGVVPGLLAAGIMAITPVAASMFGHSMEDGALIMCLVLAADAYQRAAAEGRLRSLVWAGAWVGVGFQAKMLEAWMILPALAIGYLVTAPPRLGRRLWHLCVAGTVMLAVSLSWIALYTFTPAGDRPYVDGSTNNSAVAMVFGYNGIERFGVSVPGAVASMLGGGGARGRDLVFGREDATVGRNQASSARPGQPATPPTGLPAGGQSQPGGQSGSAPGGYARTPRVARGGFAAVLGGGWTKLFGSRFGPEIGWLIPLALLALVLGLGWRRRAPRTDPVRGGLVMWGVWLLTFGVIYSEMSIIPHTAYVAALAPPIAALSAAGIVTFWRLYRSGDRRGWVLPLAVAAELAWAAYLWRSYRGFLPWALWVAIVAGAAAIAVLVTARLSKRTRGRLVMAGLVAGVAAMLAAPAAWASSVLDARYAGSSLDAGAGPAGGMGGGRGPGRADGRSLAALAALAEHYGITLPDGGRFRVPPGTAAPGGLPGTSTALTAAQQRVYDYVSAHRGGGGYLMAVQSWSSAAPYILTTGQEVLAMGGFSGSVPEPTLTHAQQLISSGQLRFFMLGGSGFGPGMAQGMAMGAGSDAQAIAGWVETSCTKVPANDYRARSGAAPIASAGPASAPASFGAADGGSGTLYECGRNS